MSTFMNDLKKELTALATEHAEFAISEGDTPVDVAGITQLALDTLRELALDPDRLPSALVRVYVGYYTQAYTTALERSR